MARARRIATIGALVLTGCWAFRPPPGEPVSTGNTSSGMLLEGESLSDRGEGFVRARPGEATRFGTPRLVNALRRAAEEVARRFPGSAPLRIGDLSSPMGGRHHRHGSHRTGRDADVLFYVTDPAGRSREGRGWLAYNRFGYAVDRLADPGGLFLFDTARNWHLVRTLLLDDEAAVQWLFVSWGVKDRLLRYGMAHETDPRVLERAAFVLQQPSNASPHDDHFHIRTLCTTREQAFGCRNRGHIWSWLRTEEEKPQVAAETTLDDEALVRAIVEPLHEDGGGDPAAGDDAAAPTQDDDR